MYKKFLSGVLAAAMVIGGAAYAAKPASVDAAGAPKPKYTFSMNGASKNVVGVARKGDFFKKAVENGIIKWMFCGHDHLNTLSLTYKGIRLTYGMSIDCLGYNGISKSYIQRGGTLITRKIDGRVDIKMIPLTRTVSTRVRGESKNQQY